MATYKVTLEDGRTQYVDSDSSDEKIIKKQANHAETSRIIIAGKRNHPPGPDPSLAVSIHAETEAEERARRRAAQG